MATVALEGTVPDAYSGFVTVKLNVQPSTVLSSVANEDTRVNSYGAISTALL